MSKKNNYSKDMAEWCEILRIYCPLQLPTNFHVNARFNCAGSRANSVGSCGIVGSVSGALFFDSFDRSTPEYREKSEGVAIIDGLHFWPRYCGDEPDDQ